MLQQFIHDVDLGLSSKKKTLPSKYFYDKNGDELFVKIMHLPEYYLTRAELQIFEQQTQSIIQALEVLPHKYFELIELGAGDGLKTKKLLQALNQQAYSFDYYPVDISLNSLISLEASIKLELPAVCIKKQHGDYFNILESLKDSHHPKVVLFLGSNIGNLLDSEAASFIYKLGANLGANDKLVLGVDLIKDASIVLPAYNDSQGITSKFNLNLLTRINSELGGNFNVENFRHKATYTEEVGIAKSYIESATMQEVYIDKIGKTFHFIKGEKIHTEISRKYNDKVVNKIIHDTDFQITTKLVDRNKYFANYILTR